MKRNGKHRMQSTVAFVEERRRKIDAPAAAKMRRATSEVRRMVEAQEDEERARILVDDSQFWVQHHEGDKWGIFSPAGELLGYRRGQAAAEAAAREVVATGTMSL
ncbi:MAG: hypothetical protein ACR2GC_10125 [Methyloceanibacter sp.]|uniref:hypothetical protein n=1 Tax=Methyloceanibacter sp. TaxID=1965321 RepID=UPI003D9B063E